MSARRRVRPCALAAVLIGLVLALDRPWLVPALLPGTRGDQAPAPAALTVAGSLNVSRRGKSQAGLAAGRASAAEPDDEALLPTDFRSGIPSLAWHDAPADRPVLNRGLNWGAAVAAGARSKMVPRVDSPDPVISRGNATFERRGKAAASSTHGGQPRTPSRGAPRASTFQFFARPVRLFTGPAPLDEEKDADADGRNDARTVIAYRDGAGPAHWARVRRPFPLFRPPRGSVRKEGGAKRRRERPPLLARLLGRGARHPPESSLSAPDLSSLDVRRPKTLPDGGSVPVRPFELEEIEAADPARLGAPSCRRRAPHWHPKAQPLGPEAQPLGPEAQPLGPEAQPLGPESLWHDGAARGVVAGDRWLWLWREEGRWWAAAGPASAPLLNHQGLWWSKQRGVWFALHEGQLWSWRRFSQWDAEGLLRLVDGVQIVYSSDFARVAVIVPGEGAVLYDAATGVELGRWREDELPRRHPPAPKDLRLPRGI